MTDEGLNRDIHLSSKDEWMEEYEMANMETKGNKELKKCWGRNKRSLRDTFFISERATQMSFIRLSNLRFNPSQKLYSKQIFNYHLNRSDDANSDALASSVCGFLGR